MRAIVTGGLGSLGTYLVLRLADEGHQVTVYDNLTKPGTRDNWNLVSALTGVEIQVRDCLAMDDYGPAGVLFHLAADCSSARSLANPLRSFRLNAMMTCQVLEAARQHMTPVVYASSVRAYPNAAGQRTMYGLGKWVGDLLCTEYARTYGLPTVSNRFGALYGVHQHGSPESGWLNWFVRATVHRLPLELQGSGEQRRDCLHCEDAVDLLMRQADWLTETLNTEGRVYHVGGGQENFVSLKEVLHCLRDVYGYSLEHVRMGARRWADTEGRPAANSAVLRDFDWAPSVSVWDGIREMVEAERQRG